MKKETVIDEKAGLPSVDIGLDISTSICGVCILETKTSKLVLLDHIKLNTSKLKDEYVKAECVQKYAERLVLSMKQYEVNSIVIEDAAKKFSPGLSSADTISTLCRFNGIVSYIFFKLFGVKPRMVNVRSARKVLGIHINHKDKSKSTKEKVLEIVAQMNPTFPWTKHLAKTGKNKNKIVYDKACEDMADSFVICRGAQLI